MKRPFTKYINSTWEERAWFLIWFTLPLSIQLNSLALGFAVLVMVISYVKKPHFIPRGQWAYLLVPMLLFMMMALGAFRSNDWLSDWKGLEKMLPLILIPGLLMLNSIKKEELRQVSLTGLVLALIISGVVMLGFSSREFIKLGDFSVFTYHSLTAPFQSGAIYYSLFLITALFEINALTWLQKRWRLKIGISAFLLLLMLLAASKLFIGLGIPLLILKHRNVLSLSVKKQKIALTLIIAVGILALIPFSQRIKTILNPNLEQVKIDQFRYDSPLNGLNLRLIQWRFGMEILEESKAWLTGLGINKAQDMLNQKYIIYGIYTGYLGTSDHGYLGYNFHNQYIETFVRTGIIGLSLLILMFFLLFTRPNDNLIVSKWVIFTCFAFFLTESALERQLGIVYFCLIYSSYFTTKLKLHHTDEL